MDNDLSVPSSLTTRLIIFFVISFGIPKRNRNQHVHLGHRKYLPHRRFFPMTLPPNHMHLEIPIKLISAEHLQWAMMAKTELPKKHSIEIFWTKVKAELIRIDLQSRLWVVHLLLSPSCMTWKKTATKKMVVWNPASQPLEFSQPINFFCCFECFGWPLSSSGCLPGLAEKVTHKQ